MRLRVPGWRKRIPARSVFTSIFGIIIFAGCAHTRTQTTVPEPGVLTLSPKEEATLEQRVDGLTHYAVGIADELNNRPKQATDQFLAAAQADPNEEGLVLEVARRLIREQRNKDAIALLQKASARPNPPGSTFALLGLAYIQAGDTNLAIAANQQSIKKAPDNLAGYQNLSTLHLQTGRTNEALAVLDHAANRTNASPEFLLGAADLLLRYNRQQILSEDATREKILRLLDAAASQNPENPLVMQRIADLYLLNGAPERSEPLYEALLKKYPSIPGLRERLANIYIRGDKNEKAARLLEEIQKDNPTDPSTYFFLGSIAYEAKDYEKAAESYETALRLNPDFEPLYYDLAGVQIARKQPEEALQLLDKARNKFKLTFTLEFYTGIAQAELENWPEALSHLTSAELIAKTSEPIRLNHVFYYQLGSVYERSGNVPDAVKALRKALELSPEYAEALNYLGYMWAERGENLDEARSMLQRAVELEPNSAAILDSYAWVLFKLGQPKEALVPMTKAIQLSKEPDPTLFDHLGDIQAALKEVEKAREAYTRSLAAKPDEKVKQKLDTLLPR
jgi:tetratricopeptide (TPR) repeat protein